jgi:serine/threonine-protein kinase ATR
VAVALPAAALLLSPHAAGAAEPRFKDLMGLNVMAGANAWSQAYDPNLYAPVTNWIRDYHPLSWDLGNNSANAATVNFRRSANNADWDKVYTQWKDGAFKINLCVQFDNFAPSSWSNMSGDAYTYGYRLATFAKTAYDGGQLVDSIQIGNEPGNEHHYTDAQYTTIFRNMAAGIRAADPTIKIATAALTTGTNNNYLRNVAVLNGVDQSLYDIIDTHSYAHKTGYPTWEPSHPEDASLNYLKSVQNLINWRNQNAPGKQLTVSEFGYDSSTKPNNTTGTFKDFIDVTDRQQAQYITRSYLEFARMDVDQAHVFYYNDSDEPTLFAGSGLTRNYVPKPSYHAVSHLMETLGDYKFDEVKKSVANDVYVYEFMHSDDPNQLIWAVWSPTGTDRNVLMTLGDLPGTPDWAELMPETAGGATQVSYTMLGSNQMQMMVGESPTYVYFDITPTAVPEPTFAGLLGIASLAMLRRRAGRTRHE